MLSGTRSIFAVALTATAFGAAPALAMPSDLRRVAVDQHAGRPRAVRPPPSWSR
jgi:hypothetical protein